MEKEKTFDHVLRATWQMIAKYYNEKAQKHDSTMAMAMALLYIDQENGTPSTALGPSMGMEATSLSRILNHMEEKGFIYREKNPADGRSVFIKLTDKGREKREISRKTVKQLNNEIREKLTDEQIDHFFDVIDAIKQTLYDKKELINNN